MTPRAVWPAVEALLNAGIEIHCLRDLTRGGLATTLNEIASDRNICIKLEETLIPVQETVQSACEILGLDPLYVANEGRFAVFVPAAQADAALEVMKKVEVSQGSVRVGKSRRNSRPHGGPAKPHRRQPRSRHAKRRAAAENLLSLPPSRHTLSS